MDYETVRLVHQSAVLVSVAGFAVRGAASLSGAAWVHGRIARSLPHLIDTVLFASALVLIGLRDGEQLRETWLLVKLLALLAYIGLGGITLRRGLPRMLRKGAFAGALVTVAWMASVAITKNPQGFLAW
ncbi:SirB2 family protein [Paucibacter sp. R3-3]|uniref:SirB2 family protein n=1 Tax=Roseateles agri TaxID=3098619 RepID=A0ABU5DRY5_9BURK|nr:SirB2 family protein [Paucibacter sp. R3-3]MDY0749083.1 SirB2 family protein [Paucibacter sp. R3-3]